MVIGCIAACSGIAQQKEVGYDEQLWFGYFNNTRFNERWGLWLDVQFRTKDHFVRDPFQFLVRPGLTYYINDRTRLTGGYAYFLHYPADNHPEIARPEHRFWQQIQWQTVYRKISTQQTFRFEQRFRQEVEAPDKLGSGYDFNYRMRANFQIQVPLSSKRFEQGDLSLVVGDEIMVNFGKQIVYNYFDQNRFLTGLRYYYQDRNSILFGYQHIFVGLSQKSHYRVLHTLRLTLLHNLDLRKSERRSSDGNRNSS